MSKKIGCVHIIRANENGKPIDAQLRSLANRAPSTLIDMTLGLNPIGGTA